MKNLTEKLKLVNTEVNNTLIYLPEGFYIITIHYTRTWTITHV